MSVEEAVHAYIVGFSRNESRVMVMSWSEGGEISQADPGVDGLDVALDLESPRADADQRDPATGWDLGDVRIRRSDDSGGDTGLLACALRLADRTMG